MIQKVKIAPLIYWTGCSGLGDPHCHVQNYQQLRKIEGMEVEIETTSFNTAVPKWCCGEQPRGFVITQESSDAIRNKLGLVGTKLVPSVVCEHMLEMD
jgi:hypothetical protein